MSWTDIKRRYEAAGGAATQSTEDMTARRILRALGLTEQKLFIAEKDAGTDKFRRDDSTLLERAVAVARARANTLYPAPEVIDAKTMKSVEQTCAEVYESSKRNVAGKAYVIYRLKGEDEVYALLCLGAQEVITVKDLPLPCTLYRSKGEGYLMAKCTAEQYFNHVIRKEVPVNG